MKFRSLNDRAGIAFRLSAIGNRADHSGLTGFGSPTGRLSCPRLGGFRKGGFLAILCDTPFDHSAALEALCDALFAHRVA